MIKKIQKYTFCHIPKTGGLTISSLIYNKVSGHKICTRENSENFLFTFVRNPYTRCYSAFRYLCNGGLNNRDKEDKLIYIENIDSFSVFVNIKLENAIKNQQHFKPQNYWIPEGADFIGKYENFVSDINRLRKIIIMKNLSIPHINKTNYNCNYTMSPQTIDIIYELYKKDFELFGYSKDSL